MAGLYDSAAKVHAAGDLCRLAASDLADHKNALILYCQQFAFAKDMVKECLPLLECRESELPIKINVKSSYSSNGSDSSYEHSVQGSYESAPISDDIHSYVERHETNEPAHGYAEKPEPPKPDHAIDGNGFIKEIHDAKDHSSDYKPELNLHTHTDPHEVEEHAPSHYDPELDIHNIADKVEEHENAPSLQELIYAHKTGGL